MAKTVTSCFHSLRTAPAKWRRRNSTERLLLLEAFAMLGVARLLVFCIPFRWLAVTIGQRMTESPTQADAADHRVASLIGQAVCSAAGTTPLGVCLSACRRLSPGSGC